jgi:hypothetical protein
LGAVPFVIIQIIMVGLIIAFPGIVSSGLDKAAVVDMDQVRKQMDADMLNTDAFDAPPTDDPFKSVPQAVPGKKKP